MECELDIRLVDHLPIPSRLPAVSLAGHAAEWHLIFLKPKSVSSGLNAGLTRSRRASRPESTCSWLIMPQCLQMSSRAWLADVASSLSSALTWSALTLPSSDLGAIIMNTSAAHVFNLRVGSCSRCFCCYWLLVSLVLSICRSS